MTDKVPKIRKEIEKLKSNLIHGACASQIAMETRCKEEAYDEVISLLDSVQEEPVSEELEAELNKYIKDNFTIDKEQLDRFNIEKKDYMYSMDKSDILTMVSFFTNLQKEKDTKIIIDVEAVSFANGMAQMKKQIGESVSEDLKMEIEKMWAQELKYRDTDYTIAELTKQDYEDCARHFANWQQEKDESTTEDLGEYVNELSKQFPEVSFAKLSRIAVRVAKWQEEKFEKNRLAHCDSQTEEEAEIERDFVMSIIENENRQPTFDDAIKYGMRLQRENMMKDAVKGLVYAQNISSGEVMIRSNCVKKEGFEFGDKVKLIVIKED